MMVYPLSFSLSSSFRNSLRFSNSFRSCTAIWLLVVPKRYSAICRFLTHSSVFKKHAETVGKAQFSFPDGFDFRARQYHTRIVFFFDLEYS